MICGTDVRIRAAIAFGSPRMIRPLCLAFALTAATETFAAPVRPPLRLATYAYPDFDRRAALAPLARTVEKVSGRPVLVELFPTPDALATAVRQGHADLAVTNLAAFTQVAGLPAAKAIAVLAPPPATLERYRGLLLARRDGGPASLSALRPLVSRLRYVEVLPGSTSGALVQAEALRSIGLRRDAFRSNGHAGTHEAALQQLLDDKADVAALAEGPWLALQAKLPDVAARLLPLWRSEPLPPGPIVCMASVQLPCRRIAGALLADSPASREAAIMLARGWSETAGARSFTRVRPARYAAFMAAPAR